MIIKFKRLNKEFQDSVIWNFNITHYPYHISDLLYFECDNIM